MEPFIDGGLIEIAIGLGLVAALNFIFLRKGLLVLYSVLVILSPALLFFCRKGPVFYCASALVFLNSVAFVILMWKIRMESPGQKLFDFKKKTK